MASIPFSLLLIAASVVILIVVAAFLASRYQRCPSNRVLVVFGRSSGEGKAARCYFGGGAFVWPVVQDFGFMSLSPITEKITLTDVATLQTVRINLDANFTFAIETNPLHVMAAAERLLGMDEKGIKGLASEIIVGQLRQTVGTMTVQELLNGRDKFLKEIHENIGQELSKVGLHLINANLERIDDSQHYIEAMGQSETSRVVNEAKVSVAEQDRIGAEGVAAAERLKAIAVANNRAQAEQGEKIAEAQTRVLVQEQEAIAATGENESAARVAESTSARAIREAEATRASTIAKADAERLSADAQAAATLAKLRSTEVVDVQIEKEKAELSAARDANLVTIAAAAQAKQLLTSSEAQKTSVELAAQARSLAISLEQEALAGAQLKMLEAKAEGERQMLQARADGLKAVVDACNGDAAAASQLLIIEKLPELFSSMSSAVSGVKIDKLTVLQGGSENGGPENGGGISSTYRDLVKIMPSVHAFADTLGIKLPALLGPATDSVPTTAATGKEEA